MALRALRFSRCQACLGVAWAGGFSPLGGAIATLPSSCSCSTGCSCQTTEDWFRCAHSSGPTKKLRLHVGFKSKLKSSVTSEDIGCRQKSSVQYLSRPDLPKLAYQQTKGKSPGVVFLPGFHSSMSAQKAVALEDFCKSLGHSFVRFDYTGCGSSEGDVKDCTIGKWKKDVLSVLDDLIDAPQILVGSSMGGWLMLLAAIARPEKIAALVGVAAAADNFVTKFNQLPVEVQKEIQDKGEWKVPTKHNEEGFYHISYDFIKEAENHCLLNSPIPITSPMKLIHGMKDEDANWHISMQIADRVLSTDVDVILRKNGQHRLNEKDDIKMLVYTIDDLIDKLTTLG